MRPQISMPINPLLSAAGRHGIASLVSQHPHAAQQTEIKPNAGNGPWQLDRMSRAAMAGEKRLRRVLTKRSNSTEPTFFSKFLLRPEDDRRAETPLLPCQGSANTRHKVFWQVTEGKTHGKHIAWFGSEGREKGDNQVPSCFRLTPCTRAGRFPRPCTHTSSLNPKTPYLPSPVPGSTSGPGLAQPSSQMVTTFPRGGLACSRRSTPGAGKPQLTGEFRDTQKAAGTYFYSQFDYPTSPHVSDWMRFKVPIPTQSWGLCQQHMVQPLTPLTLWGHPPITTPWPSCSPCVLL